MTENTHPHLLLRKRIPREVHVSLRQRVQRVVTSRSHALAYISQTPHFREPAWYFVPRCRTMMFPGITFWLFD